MILKFRKMHGLGNDFVIIDGRAAPLDLAPEQVRFIGDRRRGVGFDQLIVMEPKQAAGADIFMRIYNTDGSQARACGNATRCVADILMRENGKPACTIQTVAGLLECRRVGDGLVTVNMGVPGLGWQDLPLAKQADTLHLPLEGDPVGVSVGNPHCVFFCGNAEVEPVDKLGPSIEHDPLFPDRVNVEFVSQLGPDRLRMRVWERGAGITQACGTGACASAVAAIRRGLTGNRVEVNLDGGSLVIEWAGEGQPVFMTGPLAYVFDGSLSV